MIAVLLGLLVLPIAFAAFPGNWWGKVYNMNGQVVPDGLKVSAYIDDVLVAETTVGKNLGAGYYELFVEGKENDIVVFKIGSIDAEQTAVFSDGAHPQLDLNLTEPACGDGNCDEDAGESCSSCPEDCGACPPSGGPSGGGGGGSSCTPKWECTAWTECLPEGKMTRTCTDKNNCKTTAGKPVESQSCNYVPPKTTTTQEEEPEEQEEPETTLGEGVPAPEEKPPVTGTAVTEPSGGLGGITGMFFRNITGANKWMGLGVIILVLLVGWLFYFFVLKKKRKKE